MNYCIYDENTGEILRWVTHPEPVPAGHACIEHAFDARDGTIVDGEFVPRPTPEPTMEEKWTRVRKERNRRMDIFERRISRYHRQLRLGETPTDTLSELDAYMQALADITLQEDPDAIVWPDPPSS